MIDLGPVFSGRDTAALICNRYDGHPNEAVHAEVGGLLFEWLVEAGWVEGPAARIVFRDRLPGPASKETKVADRIAKTQDPRG